MNPPRSKDVAPSPSPAHDDSAFEPPPEAEASYAESLKLLNESQIPFLLSGALR
jgi:hypothetical protein